MAGEIPITLAGNLTADPELRFTPSGVAVANFTVASTPRNFDKSTNEWTDGTPTFMRCSIWRQAAENTAESFSKGDRVIVQGRMVSRSWEDKEGNSRTSLEVQADDVAASVKNATVKITKMGRSGGGGDLNRNAPAAKPTVEDDPWADSADSAQSDEPPF
jgi:single-strand DNA-binding protein